LCESLIIESENKTTVGVGLWNSDLDTGILGKYGMEFLGGRLKRRLDTYVKKGRRVEDFNHKMLDV
jgi:hypothetical protein